MYTVIHDEMYVPEQSVIEYETIEDIKERYSAYPDLIDKELKGMKSGDSVGFMYDFYIDLDVTKS